MILSKEQILERLLENKPISIVRCGDGEKLVLDCTSSYSALQLCNQAVLNRQLGYSPSVDQIEAIRQNLVDAYNGADIIGIPNHTQKTNSHWGKVVEVLNKNAPDHTGQLCDIDVAYHFLSDGSYDTLLQSRNVLNYISCRNLDHGFRQKWGIDTINKYTIAPEVKWTSGYDGELHYPTQFNKIARWMDVMKQRHPGSLLLVGAGVIGKIYCNWWRDRGGVAMDIGGVMDIFAGRITRGPERGLDKVDIDSIYKL